MKFRISLLIWFVLMAPIAYAQSNPLSELKAQLSETKSSTDRLQKIEEYCLEYLWNEPFLADTMVQLLEKEAAEKQDSFYIARGHFFRGILKFNWKKLEDAYEDFLEARKYFEEIDSQKQLAEVYHNIGLVHNDFLDSAQSLKYLLKAKEINKRHGYYEQLIKNEFIIITLESDISKKLDMYVSIRDSSLKFNYDEGVLLADLNSGVIGYHLGYYEKTLGFVENAEMVMKRSGITKYASELYEVKAAAYWTQLNYHKAEEYFKKALEGYRKKNARMRISEVYLNLGEINNEAGELDSSISYLKKYIALQDSILITDKREIIKEVEASYRLEYQEKENALLRKEAKLDDAKLETASRQKILLILLLVITLLTIALLTARYNTKQKHYHEVEQINSQLNSLNLEMESILQMVSHDFRTPLAKIKMAGELLGIQEKDLSDKSKKKLETINTSVAEAEELVSDILEVKQFISDENPVLDPQMFDVNAEIKGICAHYDQPLILKNIEIDYTHSGETEVFAVKEMIKRIVGNLVSNAVKFSPHDTKIHVKTSVVNSRLTLIVIDNGPGFKEADKINVFKKFPNIENRPVSWGSSHGLGLFIVKKLVDQLGGEITLNSNPGKGAEFVVSLPVETQST